MPRATGGLGDREDRPQPVRHRTLRKPRPLGVRPPRDSPILANTGKGVCEAGPCFWLSEDVFVTGQGSRVNQAGLDQLLPAVRRSAGLDASETTMLRITFAGPRYFDAKTGIRHHPDMVFGRLDVDKVIAYPSGLDFDTWQRPLRHDADLARQ